jgi:TIR domain
MPPPAKDQVFISYSHKDTKWRKDLEIHLKPYLRDGPIKGWSDQQIVPDSKWFEEIKSALAQTKVAVLLVTPDFLASDFIHEHELGPLLKEAEKGGVTIVRVPVYASAYKKTAIESYQAVLSPETPLAGISKPKRAQAWVRICEEIEKAVNGPEPLPQSPPAPPHPVIREIMQFLMLKRQELDSRPELLTVIGLLKQEWEANRGKGSPSRWAKERGRGQPMA